MNEHDFKLKVRPQFYSRNVINFSVRRVICSYEDFYLSYALILMFVSSVIRSNYVPLSLCQYYNEYVIKMERTLSLRTFFH